MDFFVDVLILWEKEKDSLHFYFRCVILKALQILRKLWKM